MRRTRFTLLGLGLVVAACAGSTPTQRTELRSASTWRPSLADEVAIRELDVPTPNALPHDPAVAPDGALWVTEEKANKLGRLDPRTGAFREVPLRTPASGPHGIAIDAAGNVWFTANHAAYVGKLTPSTGEMAEYFMPDPRARDPHTPVLGADGMVWFTVQRSNFVGRLDPRTGDVTLAPVPTANALPYGMAIGADGAAYFCEFGANAIGRVDGSMAIREFALPEGARPRRIALAPDGTLYYSDYARGKLGRLDPRTGAVDEWPSPAGPASKPYGLAITPDGRVWYSETGPSPNTLVRFDPKARRFASMAIPSGGGVVRNMVSTKDGRLYIAESGVDKVAIATPWTRAR